MSTQPYSLVMPTGFRGYFHAIISCFIKIQIGLTFLVPVYPDCHGTHARQVYFRCGHWNVTNPVVTGAKAAENCTAGERWDLLWACVCCLVQGIEWNCIYWRARHCQLPIMITDCMLIIPIQFHQLRAQSS